MEQFQEDKCQNKWLLVDEVVSVTLAVSLLGVFIVTSVVVMAYVMAVGIIGVVFTLCRCNLGRILVIGQGIECTAHTAISLKPGHELITKY